MRITRALAVTALLMMVSAWPAAADDGERVYCPLEHEDASFCSGPSDRALHAPGDPFVSMLTGCGPDGTYLELAVGAGLWTVTVDGEPSSYPVAAADLSELGLATFGMPAAAGAEVLVEHDGTVVSYGIVEDACPVTTVPVAAGATLPHTGVSVPLLVVAGAVLLMVGAWLSGWPRA